MWWLLGAAALVEGVSEADPVDRRLMLTPRMLSGALNTQGFQNRRDEVDDVRVLRPQLAARLDALRPRHDARIGGAAPVGLALPAAEGRVAGIRPAPRRSG